MDIRFRPSNENTLGNGLEEIKFFSKDVDYDKLQYEAHVLSKENNTKEKEGHRKILLRNNKLGYADPLKVWEEGGPVKALRLPDFDVYPLYFKNYQDLEYEQLKGILGNFFTLGEFENQNMRVTYHTEEDLRASYKALKKDSKYRVRVKLDVKNGCTPMKNEFNKNQRKISHNKKEQNLISRWLNKKGDVVTDTAKQNSFPIQINNYRHFGYDDLMKLFLKYGKFSSISDLENDSVQVKFSSEDAARECYKDLSKDHSYNVRLLFFLKELNSRRKLVKDLPQLREEECVNRLLAAEDKIKFTALDAQTINLLIEQKKSRLRKIERMNDNVSTSEDNIKWNRYFRTRDDPRVYVEGTPLYNSYLTPPYSYLVWRNAKNHLPPPPPPTTDDTDEKRDLNYKYYLETLRMNSLNSPSEDSGRNSSLESDEKSSVYNHTYEHCTDHSAYSNDTDQHLSSPENDPDWFIKKYSWKFNESFTKLYMC